MMVTSRGQGLLGPRCHSSCVRSGLPLAVLSPGPMNITRQLQPPAHQRQPQHPQQHPPLSHLSTHWHWASLWNKCSGASPVSLIQEMGNWTLGCMTHLKAADNLVKTWDTGTLVPRLWDFQEGKDERTCNCIQCGGACRCLQAPDWRVLSLCPSSLIQILSAYLPPCSSKKAIFRAFSSGLAVEG